MNRTELKIKLDELGIDEKDYSLYGQLKPVSQVLLYKSNKWFTFHYDEHGLIIGEKIFDSEDEACMDLFNYLKTQKEWRTRNNISN